ncbi:hypothetical protein E2C01_086671 [Portunus trituberculatus]|uniref:Uncharacterized protein n=1 Tax=Portunus trituberculatus TaxID=210409 RepID=A0A5B7J622_PORTR|nr:hypothetical protein [Portunus trituberculatus]
MSTLIPRPSCTRLSSSHPYSIQHSNVRVNHYSLVNFGTPYLLLYFLLSFRNEATSDLKCSIEERTAPGNREKLRHSVGSKWQKRALS